MIANKPTAFPSTPDTGTSFAAPPQRLPGRQAIALISVHGDPAAEIGQEEAGGQNVYVRQMGEALAQQGWEVDLFTRKANADAPAIVQHSPHCRTIRLKAGPEIFVPRDQIFEYLPEFVHAFKIYHSKHGYPLVHTNYWLSGWVGWQLKQQLNVQWLHTYHSLGAAKYLSKGKVPAIAQRRLAIEKDVLERADVIIATSPQEQEDMESLVSPRGNIVVIPCGTDTKNFHAIPKETARQKLGLAPGEPLVLYVGRFDRRKGIETLVRACGLLRERQGMPQPRLVIVGGSDPDRADGAERRRIEAIVEELGLGDRTTFAGQVSHDQLPLYYAAADVCGIPSHYEPFGLVAIEAMACGTPVVASAVGGLKFSVRHEVTGLLVPPKDTVAFADAIAHILTNQSWANQMQNHSVEWVQGNFSWMGVAHQLSGLYWRYLAASLMSMEKGFIVKRAALRTNIVPMASYAQERQRRIKAL